MARPGFAISQHVAVGVNGSLGRARGARSEGQDGDVVGRSRAGRSHSVFGGGQRLQTSRIVRLVKGNHGLELLLLGLRHFQFSQQLAIAQGQGRLGFENHLGELLGAQQRHGRHRHQPGVHHTQPGQCHAHRIATAQEHPVAGYQAVVFGQYLGNAADAFTGFCVTHRKVFRAQKGPRRPTLLSCPRQERRYQIGLRRDLQLRCVVAQLRPLVGARQSLMHKAIGLG